MSHASGTKVRLYYMGMSSVITRSCLCRCIQEENDLFCFHALVNDWIVNLGTVPAFSYDRLLVLECFGRTLREETSN